MPAPKVGEPFSVIGTRNVLEVEQLRGEGRWNPGMPQGGPYYLVLSQGDVYVLADMPEALDEVRWVGRPLSAVEREFRDRIT